MFYERFISGLGITFTWHINKDTNKLEGHVFTGPEELNFFAAIDIMHLLPGNPKAVHICKLWSDFMLLIKTLKEDYISTERASEIHRRIEQWMDDFLAIYQAKDITPYMHAFLYHVVEMLIIHKNINFFNQPGLEKLNDSCTKDLFKSTNMKGMDALKQIMY